MQAAKKWDVRIEYCPYTPAFLCVHTLRSYYRLGSRTSEISNNPFDNKLARVLYNNAVVRFQQNADVWSLKAQVSDILEKLKGGDLRSIGSVPEVVVEVSDDPALFVDLFNGLFNDDPVVRMRAADAVEKITAEHPELLQPFKEAVLDRVSGIEQQEVRWHVAQMLPRLALNPRELDRAVGILVDYLDDKSRIVQTFSLQALSDMASGNPKLRPVVVLLLQEKASAESPAVRKRAAKLLDGFTP